MLTLILNYQEVQLRNCAERFMQMDKTHTKTHTNGFFKKPQIRNPLVLLVWQGSSVGESAGFITQRSGVQISLLLPAVARD